MSTRNIKNRGFIALISTVVISAILLVLMASVGTASFYARFDSLGGENRQAALALADACANVALLALATSTDPMHYSVVNKKVIVGSDSSGNPLLCFVGSITHNGSNAMINAYASSRNSFESVSVVALVSQGVQIVSWNEN